MGLWLERHVDQRRRQVDLVHVFNRLFENRRGVHFELGVDGPDAGSTNATLPDVENRNRRGQLARGESDDVDIEFIAQHNGAALGDGLQRTSLIAKTSRRFKVLALGRTHHPLTKIVNHRGIVLCHELDESLREPSMFLGGHSTDTRSRTFPDITEKARAVVTSCLGESRLCARPHRVNRQQQIQGFADRPRLGEGTEIGGPVLHPRSSQHCARVFLAHRHRQIGVTLVITESNVERRAELLDPGELKMESLEFRPNDCPVHSSCTSDHPGRAFEQPRRAVEIG